MTVSYGFANMLGDVFRQNGNGGGGLDAYAKGQLAGSQMANYQSQADEHNKNAAIKQRQLDLMSDDELFKSSLATQGVDPKYNQLANEFRTTGLWGPNQTFDDASAPPQIQAMHPIGGVPAAMPDDLFMKDAGLRQLYADYGNSRKSIVDGKSTAKDIAEATNISLGQVFDMGSNGMIYGKYTGGVDMSNPTNQSAAQFINAKTATELAQGRNYDASAGKSRAETYQINQGSNLVLPSNINASQLMDALVMQESSGNPNAVSPKGARGLAQIMPATRDEIMQATGIDAYASPENNRKAGEWYLNLMMQTFGDPQFALAAYNAGAGRVQQAMQQDKANGGDGTYASVSRFLPAQTRAYVPGVISRMGGFQQKQAKDGDAVTTKAASLTLPKYLEEGLNVYQRDEKGAVMLGGQSGVEPIIDPIATQKKMQQVIQAYNQSGGGVPFAQFVMQYNGQGARPAPQVQPQAAPRLSQQQELQLAQDAIAKGAPAQAVFDAMRQRGIDPSPLMPKPAAKPVAQPQRANPQPAAVQKPPAKPPQTVSLPPAKPWSANNQQAKMPVVSLPSFGLHGDPNAGAQFGPRPNSRDAQAQQIAANILAKQFMFGW